MPAATNVVGRELVVKLIDQPMQSEARNAEDHRCRYPRSGRDHTEIDISAPPARVFEALIDPDQLMCWFTNASCPVKFWRMDPRLGGSYSYATKKSVSEFECHGEITEMNPPHLLVYTWFGNWHVDPETKTVVRWELRPIDSGTHVKVTHSGLAQDPASRKDYSGGWPGVVGSLKEFVERTLRPDRKD
jgi:uncharacterized protein YndB with AHSA1/START domain